MSLHSDDKVKDGRVAFLQQLEAALIQGLVTNIAPNPFGTRNQVLERGVGIFKVGLVKSKITIDLTAAVVVLAIRMKGIGLVVLIL